MSKPKVSPAGSLAGYSPLVAFVNNVQTKEFLKGLLGLGLAAGIALLTGYADWQTLLKTFGVAAITFFAKTYGIDLVDFWRKDVKLN